MDEYKDKMEPSTEEVKEEVKEEQLSLSDDRRVKVLSPGALVAKRFFRNRLAVTGMVILVAMFLFSFLGGLLSPYDQDRNSTEWTPRQRITRVSCITMNTGIQ